MSSINKKKYRIKITYLCLALMLFLSSFQLLKSNGNIISPDKTGNDASYYSNTIFDLSNAIFSVDMNYGTNICFDFSYGLANNHIIDSVFFSINSSNIQAFPVNRISHMTSIIVSTGDIIGTGGAFSGLLIIIGTISLDTNKYQDSRRELFRNKNRLIIKSIINDNPGITLREIQRTSSLAMGVIQYHIYNLESAEIKEVDSLKLGRSKHFFINYPGFSPKEKIWFSLNRNDNIKGILDFLGSFADQCSQKDLTYLTGNSKSLISYYIKILKHKGIIEVENHQLRISEDFKEINNKYCT